MAKATVDYRKSFIKTVLNQRPNTPSTHPFPLKYEHPDVQLCASTFLETNHGIFQGSASTPPTLLKYPEDTQEIINVLAKIFCCQELSHRKNHAQKINSASNGDDAIAASDCDSSEEHIVKRPRKSVGKDYQLFSFDDDDEPRSDPVYSPAAAQQKKAQGPVDAHLRHNTKVHLDIAYPAVGTVEGTDGAFLFVNGAAWPENVWGFTFRFMHEQKAYKLRGTNHARNFVNAVKQHFKYYKLPNNLTREEDARLSKKCGRYLGVWAAKWIECGLLVQKDEQVFRHSYFDEKLGIYRAQWIAGVHGGSTKDVIELQKPALPVLNNSLKRPASVPNLKQDPHGFEPFLEKRAKVDLENTSDNDSRANADLWNGLQGRYEETTANFPPVGHGSAQSSNRSRETTRTRDLPSLVNGSTVESSISSGEASAHVQSKALGIVMPTPRPASSDLPRAKACPSRSFSSFPANDTNGANDAKSQAEVSRPGTSSSTPKVRPWWAGSKSSGRPPMVDTASPPLALPQEALKKANGTHSPVLTLPERVAGRVSIPSGLGTPLPTEKWPTLQSSLKRITTEEANTPAGEPILQSPQSKLSNPSFASLKMIIEKAEGEMDFDNPMSEADLSVASFNEFIEGVRSRRMNPGDTIRVLRFKQRWGANKVHMLNQSTSDEVWKKVRHEIKRNFETMRDKKPDRKKFEVDVLVEGDEEDGDDGDDGDE